MHPGTAAPTQELRGGRNGHWNTNPPPSARPFEHINYLCIRLSFINQETIKKVAAKKEKNILKNIYVYLLRNT